MIIVDRREITHDQLLAMISSPCSLDIGTSGWTADAHAGTEFVG
jgi:hypothetical protein